MERNLHTFLSAKAAKLLAAIETTTDEKVRLDAINELALTQDIENCRALIEAFERTPWRAIRMSIMRGLGGMQQPRATEFLLRWAAHADDLPMASTALISLGATQDPAAGAFLLSILADVQHPLRREAVIALTKMELFPLFSALFQAYEQLPEEGFASLRQYLIIAAGITGSTDFRETVIHLLTKKNPSIKGSEGDQGMLFSAALLTAGRIGDQKVADLLQEIDTSHRFFAEQLRVAAHDALCIRLQAGVEDAVNALIAADTMSSLKQALHFLQTYQTAEAWEACSVFEDDLSLEKKALVRAFLPEKQRASADLNFLQQHFAELSRAARAALFRAVTLVTPDAKLVEWFDHLPLSQLTTLAQDAKHPALTQRLQKLLAQKTKSLNEAEGMSVINALVRQASMYQEEEALRLDIGKSLHKLASDEVSQRIKERSFRALGQIAWTDLSNLQNLAQQHLKTDDPMLVATYAMLGNHGDQRWVPLVVKRLRTIGQRTEAKIEVGLALGVLADLERTEGAALQFELHADHKQQFRGQILRIMAHHMIDGMDAVIEWGLGSEDFQTLLLALAASRNNGRDSFWTRICELTKHSNACIRGRAVDSLCVAAGPEQHRFLIETIAADPHDEEFITKVLRTMLPAVREGRSYAEIIRQLEQLLRKDIGVFRHQDVKSAATHLIDRLASFDAAQAPGRAHEGGTDAGPLQYSLDRELENDLDGYKGFSETVRSIIRNAELTYRNPELFDERVDKSTVVVEFVKSIDIFLQERLGTPLFGQNNRDLLAKMQSLILKLDLDREQLDGGAVIVDIECHDIFKQFDFPTHKLQSLVRSIMSGKIMHEQYRVIDGLRAWSLLLLLFGRSFKFQGQKIEAIFPIKNKNARAMASLCFELNAMQELRNAAAHRATLLSGAQIQEFRQHSLGILNQLAASI